MQNSCLCNSHGILVKRQPGRTNLAFLHAFFPPVPVRTVPTDWAVFGTCLQVTHTMADMIRSLSALSALLTNEPGTEDQAASVLRGRCLFLSVFSDWTFVTFNQRLKLHLFTDVCSECACHNLANNLFAPCVH